MAKRKQESAQPEPSQIPEQSAPAVDEPHEQAAQLAAEPDASHPDGGDDPSTPEVQGVEIAVGDVLALAARMEALLFVSPRPVSARRLADLLGTQGVIPIRQAAEFLTRTYEGRAFTLAKLAGGYQILTRPEFEGEVLKLQKQKKAQKLTPGALEALAVIAYKQPITRNDIDAIRGVSSDHHIRALAERNLIKIVGRKEGGGFGIGGAPALYGTTTQFLNEFGLQSVSELPVTEDLSTHAPATEAAKDLAN